MKVARALLATRHQLIRLAVGKRRRNLGALNAARHPRSAVRPIYRFTAPPIRLSIEQGCKG